MPYLLGIFKNQSIYISQRIFTGPGTIPIHPSQQPFRVVLTIIKMRRFRPNKEILLPSIEQLLPGLKAVTAFLGCKNIYLFTLFNLYCIFMCCMILKNKLKVRLMTGYELRPCHCRRPFGTRPTTRNSTPNSTPMFAVSSVRRLVKYSVPIESHP